MSHRPDRIGLVDYLEGSLPPEANIAIEHHLDRCETCRAALEQERRMLQRLDRMGRVEPPEDFVQAVMGRVAQQPPHRPSTPVPWGPVVGWSAALAASLMALLVGGFWVLGRSGTLAEAGVADYLGRLVALVAEGGTDVIGVVRQVLGPVSLVVEALNTAGWGLLSMATGSSWAVQVGLLVLTVTLNYAFARLVLSYQRQP